MIYFVPCNLNLRIIMYGKMKEHLSKSIAEIKEAGLYKEERLIESAQQAAITVKGIRHVVCSLYLWHTRCP